MMLRRKKEEKGKVKKLRPLHFFIMGLIGLWLVAPVVISSIVQVTGPLIKQEPNRFAEKMDKENLEDWQSGYIRWLEAHSEEVQKMVDATLVHEENLMNSLTPDLYDMYFDDYERTMTELDELSDEAFHQEEYQDNLGSEELNTIHQEYQEAMQLLQEAADLLPSTDSEQYNQGVNAFSEGYNQFKKVLAQLDAYKQAHE